VAACVAVLAFGCAINGTYAQSIGNQHVQKLAGQSVDILLSARVKAGQAQTREMRVRHALYFLRDGRVLFGVDESAGAGAQGVSINSLGRYYTYDVPGLAGFGSPHRYRARMDVRRDGSMVVDGDIQIKEFNPSYRIQFSFSVNGSSCSARFLSMSAYGKEARGVRITPRSAQCRVRRGGF